MDKKNTSIPVDADVLIHTYGRKPSEETFQEIMRFIEENKDKADELTGSEMDEIYYERSKPHKPSSGKSSDGSGEVAEGC